MWSVCENLLCLDKCLTLVATHNTYLTQIVNTYRATQQVTLSRFQIMAESQTRVEILTELDPQLFCDSDFYTDVVSAKQQISDLVAG